MKKFFCRITSAVLTVVMSTAFMPPALAENYEVIPLDASRLAGDRLPEGNLIYMGTAAASLKEGDTVYEFPVYREGDLSGAASVDVHTIDMTAVYGKDYEIVNEEVERTGDKTSLLELSVTTLSQDEAVADDKKPETYGETEDASEKYSAEPSGYKAVVSSDGKMSLRELKEAQTGEETRDPYESASDTGLTQELMTDLVPEMMQSLKYSSEFKVEFAPGEAEKKIRFRIIDDNKSEGNEGFSLLLVNPEGAEVYEVTSLSVTIEDDEPTEHSKISFSKNAYKSKDGIASIKITRKGAEYSLCDFTLISSGQTAEAGENYEEVNELIAFLPYETEKNIDIPVSGTGTFKLMMRDMSSCEEGKYTEAVVKINEKGSADGIRLMSDDDYIPFTIDVGNKSYEVQYVLPDGWPEKHPTEGTIYDTNYEPYLEVGKYYFASDTSHGGNFKYGYTSGDDPDDQWWGHWTSEYTYDDRMNDMTENYGTLEYYNPVTWCNGKAYTVSERVFPSIYYQYVSPHWTSTTGTFGGQGSKFTVYEYDANNHQLSSQSTTVEGEFDVTASNAALKLADGNDIMKGKLEIRAYAIDDADWHTPKCYNRFYGVAAMYKRYDVKVFNPNTYDYKVGNETQTRLPFQTYIESGAEREAGYSSRSFYANTDESKTNMVITVANTDISGHYNIFGTVSGYDIVINSGTVNDKVTLSYPSDFYDFLDENEGENYSDVLDFSSEKIAAEKAKVEQNLESIPYDAYFVYWIDSKQKSYSTDSPGYHQMLEITPKANYIDSKVTVLPSYGADGSFDDDALKLNSEEEKQYGKTLTYHAGDILELGATADDTENYYAVGYMVSKDNGEHYDIITSTKELFLEPNYDYLIRPCVTTIKNRIEIIYDDGAENYLEVQNLLPQSTLQRLIENSSAIDAEENKKLLGRYFLDANPDAETLNSRLNPTVGELYNINITSVEDENYIYRPVITQEAVGTFTTNSYHTKAKMLSEENVVHIGYKKVSKNDLISFNVKGTIMSHFRPVRNNGLEITDIPVSGYTLMAGQGTQSKNTSGSDNTPQYTVDGASASSGTDGTFCLQGIKGQPGDVITIGVTNSITSGDVVTAILTDRGGVDRDTGNFIVKAGSLEITYPSNAPSVSSVSYTYGKDSNNNGEDLTRNQIAIKDDNFVVTAQINKNGHSIKKAIFTVITTKGVETEYEAVPESDDSSLITCTIESMSDSLFSGDRLYVRLVDGEDHVVTNDEYDDNGNKTGNTITNTVSTEYPRVDTGLMFYTENNITVPQTFDAVNAATIDIPLVGSATGVAQSGRLNFGKTYWDNAKTGYTIQVNLDALYNTKGSPSTAEKAGLYSMFHRNGEKAKINKNTSEEMIASAQERLDTAAIYEEYEDVFGDYRGGIDVDKEKEYMADAQKKMKDAKNPYSGFNAKILSVDLAIVLAFDFVKDPVTNEYIFSHGTAALGGTVAFSKTWYFAICNVPVFINASLTLQANIVGTYSTEEGMNALTAGDFDGYEGNLTDVLSEDYEIGLNVMLTGKVQVGVGICGVLDARGYVSLTFQFDMQFHDLDMGAMLGAKGGIGIDFLFFSLDLDIASVNVGFGTMANRSNFSFFGGLAGSGAFSTLSLPEEENDEDKIIAVKDNEVIKEHVYSYGSTDMSGFGSNKNMSLMSIPKATNINVLLQGAAEHTRPHIIQLDGDKKLVTFIGASDGRDEANSAALYYSVYDGESWSVPLQVSDDGTADSESAVKKYGDKVYIVWTDADRPITDDDNESDKLSSLGISMAVYDIASGTMSGEISLIDDAFLNMSPQIAADGDDVYVSYMKRDLSEMRDEMDLTDLGYLYSTMAYVKYDAKNGVKSEEHFITIPHSELTDPLVTDYRSEITEIGGKSYALSAYTVDGDENLSTGDDRELYLKIENLTDNESYYPIQITDNSVCETIPKLTVIDGEIYLTWFEDGYIFKLTNISDILTAIFAPEDFESFSAESIRAAFAKSDFTAEGWWIRSADELGMDENMYDGTIYSDIAEGNWRVSGANFSNNSSLRTSIGSYTVTSDGKDIYIFYTEFGKNIFNTGMEIYGVRYKSDNTFSTAVQITDFDKVIDEMDLYMTDGGYLYAVSNYYSQWIDESGKIRYGENELVQIDFEPSSSVKIVENSLVFPDKLVPGSKSRLEFEVENAGLLDAAGYNVTVSEVRGGSETVIFNEDIENALTAGDKSKVYVPWTLPEDVDNVSVKIAITEKGMNDTLTEIRQIPRRARLKADNLTTSGDGGEYTASATVSNDGNIPSDEVKIRLVAEDSNYKSIRTLASASVPALEAGEKTDIKLDFSLSVEDFDNHGYVNIRLEADDGENTASAYNKILPSKPVVAEINGGSEKILMKTGDTVPIETKAAPLESKAGDVQYYSSDNDIAVVNEDGEIVAAGEGTATIYAYYTLCGATDSIEVMVSDTAVSVEGNTISISYNEERSASVLIAKYDTDGSLKSLYVQPDVQLKNGITMIDAGQLNTTLETGDKIMIWNSPEGMKPLVAATTIGGAE